MISSIEPKAFELVCYMVTSACNLLNENRLYGPFRLIDAVSRLITLLEEEGVRSKRLKEIRERIVAEGLAEGVETVKYLSDGGLTPREAAGRKGGQIQAARWEALPEAEKEAKRQELRKQAARSVEIRRARKKDPK